MIRKHARPLLCKSNLRTFTMAAAISRQACLQCSLSGKRSGLRQSFGDEAQLRGQSLGSALAPLWGCELAGATPRRLLDALEKEIAPE